MNGKNKGTVNSNKKNENSFLVIQMLLHRSREHTYHKMQTGAVTIKIERLLDKNEGSESHEITKEAKENKKKR